MIEDAELGEILDKGLRQRPVGYTVEEAADILGVCGRTVYRLIDSGRLEGEERKVPMMIKVYLVDPMSLFTVKQSYQKGRWQDGRKIRGKGGSK